MPLNREKCFLYLGHVVCCVSLFPSFCPFYVKSDLLPNYPLKGISDIIIDQDILDELIYTLLASCWYPAFVHVFMAVSLN